MATSCGDLMDERGIQGCGKISQEVAPDPRRGAEPPRTRWRGEADPPAAPWPTCANAASNSRVFGHQADAGAFLGCRDQRISATVEKRNRCAAQRLVGEDAERVEIRAPVDIAGADPLLGRHVQGRANDRTLVGEPAGLLRSDHARRRQRDELGRGLVGRPQVGGEGDPSRTAAADPTLQRDSRFGLPVRRRGRSFAMPKSRKLGGEVPSPARAMTPSRWRA